MKNENEPEPQIERIDQEQHEKLCAYVFGELQGEERAAFERELLRSPALQAERERLTATIGLVKRAIPDEGLSARVRGDIVAAVNRSRFRFLKGRTLALVAAALLALVGGAVGLRFLLPGTATVLDSIKVAQRSEPTSLVDRNLANQPAAGMRGRSEQAKALDALRGLGYSAGDSAGEVSAHLDALGYGGEDSNEPVAGLSGFRAGAVQPTHDAFGVQTTPAPGESQSNGGAFLSSGQTIEPYPLNAAGAPAVTYAWKNTALQDLQAAIGAGGGAGGAEVKTAARAGGAGGKAFARYNKPLQSTDLDGRMVSLRRAMHEPTQEDIGDVERYLAEQASLLRGEDRELGFMSDSPLDSEAFADTLQEGNHREPIPPEQITAIADELLAVARLQPGESPRDMFFRYFGDGPFVPSREENTSTFAVDVDTASYALMRAYLNQGQLPPRESVRTEEFVNYFKADQPPPPTSQGGDPFAIGLELAPSLFASDPRTEILRVTVRGKDVADFERQPAALTLVIDDSGSMEEGGRLELVKRALSLLLRELYAADSVAVVKFSNQASVVTPPLPAARRGELEGLIQAIPIEGGTNVEAGLRLGFELASQNLARNAVNRVVLCSDGVGNIGETSAKALLELVKESRAKGIYLNTVGVGMGNHNDAFLEELADKGDGVCNYVDSDAEAKKVFVDGLAKAIQPIARDVKIQVELDPAQVESWRLLGYENRALRNQDFKDDRIDAGEVNAGHQVTALYELVRNPHSDPVATVRVRYQPPFAIDRGDEGSRARAEAEQALEIERSIDGSAVRAGFAAASAGFRRSALVAQLAEVLRQSVHARGDSFARLVEEAKRLEGELGDPDFTEFVKLLGLANPLLDQRAKQETPRFQELLDRLARLHYEQGLEERKRELEAQAREDTARAAEAFEERLGAVRDELATRDAERRAEIERLEQEVRELVRREYAPQDEKARAR